VESRRSASSRCSSSGILSGLGRADADDSCRSLRSRTNEAPLGLGQVQPLSDGAAFTGAGFAPLFDPNNFYRYLVGEFTPHANRGAVEHWNASKPGYFSPATVPSLPVEIDRVHQIDWLS
jgi:hypothetical protein